MQRFAGFPGPNRGCGALCSAPVLPSRRTARIGAARAPRVALAVGLVVLFVASIVSCGASIQAVYEGDVRFEHCMALDARADVPRGLRMTCWGEWRTFYSYGQTLDRIEYARGREKALSESQPVGDVPKPPPIAPPAVPEPTSVLVPPPMMLAVDGGRADAPSDAADAGEPPPPPAAACSADCEHAFRFCQQECKTSPCEKTCAAKYKRCMHRCF